MNALTAVKANTDDLAQRHTGFTLAPSAQSPRLLALTFTADTTRQFLHQVAQWPVQALEYKSFLRFKIGKILDDLCGNQLQPLLIKTLLNRAQGALLISAEGIDDVAQAEEMVKLATAVAHLIGRSNYDAMSGQYYARFVVKNVDNSDSYLRQPHRVMELHNDGTYVEEVTDYVLMMKIDEQNMEGGNSLLLHLDDWEHLESFLPIRWRVASCAGRRRQAKMLAMTSGTRCLMSTNKAARSCVISTSSSSQKTLKKASGSASFQTRWKPVKTSSPCRYRSANSC